MSKHRPSSCQKSPSPSPNPFHSSDSGNIVHSGLSADLRRRRPLRRWHLLRIRLGPLSAMPPWLLRWRHWRNGLSPVPLFRHRPGGWCGGVRLPPGIRQTGRGHRSCCSVCASARRGGQRDKGGGEAIPVGSVRLRRSRNIRKGPCKELFRFLLSPGVRRVAPVSTVTSRHAIFVERRR
jgi:hypothetical protein